MAEDLPKVVRPEMAQRIAAENNFPRTPANWIRPDDNFARADPRAKDGVLPKWRRRSPQARSLRRDIRRAVDAVSLSISDTSPHGKFLAPVVDATAFSIMYGTPDALTGRSRLSVACAAQARKMNARAAAQNAREEPNERLR